MQAGNSAKFYPEFRKTFLPMYVIIIWCHVWPYKFSKFKNMVIQFYKNFTWISKLLPMYVIDNTISCMTIKNFQKLRKP
jgi:hypothetical protein